MRKSIIIFFVVIILSTVFSGCSAKQCDFCDTLDVQYEAFFVPGQSTHYLCDNCYQERKGNPTFDDFWIITPI